MRWKSVYARTMVEDQSASITAASWTLGAVSIMIVGLRLYTRLLLTRLPGWDDFFITLSLVTNYDTLKILTASDDS